MYRNLETQFKDVNKRDDKKYGNVKESKGVFFPSNKKIYDANMFQCSEDFKQLGTLHHENRAADYYPLDRPQPLEVQPSPLVHISMDQVMAGSAKAATKTGYQSFDMRGAETDPDKNRSDHIKSLVADRMKEEEMRNRLIAKEIIKMKRKGPHSNSVATPQLELSYPITTNQETHNDE